MGRRHCCKEEVLDCCAEAYGGREPWPAPPSLHSIKWSGVEITDSILEEMLGSYGLQAEYYDVDSIAAMSFDEYQAFVRRIQLGRQRYPASPPPSLTIEEYRQALTFDWDFISHSLDFSDVMDVRQPTEHPRHQSYLDTEFSSGRVFGKPFPTVHRGSGKYELDLEKVARMSDCEFWNTADGCSGTGGGCYTKANGFERYQKNETVGPDIPEDGFDLGVQTWDMVGLKAPAEIPIDTIEWETVECGSFNVYIHNATGNPLYRILDTRPNSDGATVDGPTEFSIKKVFKFRIYTGYCSQIGNQPVAVGAIPVAIEQGDNLWGARPYYGPYDGDLSTPLHSYSLFANTYYKPANSRLDPDTLGLCQAPYGASYYYQQDPFVGISTLMNETHKHSHIIAGRDKDTLEAWHTAQLAGANIRVSPAKHLYPYLADDEVQDRVGPYHAKDPNLKDALTRTGFTSCLVAGSTASQSLTEGGYDNATATVSFPEFITPGDILRNRLPSSADGGPLCPDPLFAYSPDGWEPMSKDDYISHSNARAEFRSSLVDADPNGEYTFNDINIAKLFQGDSGSVTFSQAVSAGKFTAFTADGLNLTAGNLAQGFTYAGGRFFQPAFYNSAPYGNRADTKMGWIVPGDPGQTTIPDGTGGGHSGSWLTAPHGPFAGEKVFSSVYWGGGFPIIANRLTGIFHPWGHANEFEQFHPYNEPHNSRKWAPDVFGGDNRILSHRNNSMPYVPLSELAPAIEQTKNTLYNRLKATGHRHDDDGDGLLSNYPNVEKVCLGNVSRQVYLYPETSPSPDESASITFSARREEPLRYGSSGDLGTKVGASHNAILDADSAVTGGSLPPATGNWLPTGTILDPDKFTSVNPNKYNISGPSRGFTIYPALAGNTLIAAANQRFAGGTRPLGSNFPCPEMPGFQTIYSGDMEVNFTTASYAVTKYTAAAPNPTIRIFGFAQTMTSPPVEIQNNDTTPMSSDGTDFGAILAGADETVSPTLRGRHRYFRIDNSLPGAIGPLIVTSISVPRGFIKPTKTSYFKDVKCGTYKVLTLVLDSTAEPGIKGGTVVIKNNTGTDFTFDIIGQVIGPD